MSRDTIYRRSVTCCPYSAANTQFARSDLACSICQHATIANASRPVNGLWLELLRIRRHWRTENFSAFLRRQLAGFRSRIVRSLQPEHNQDEKQPTPVACIAVGDAAGEHLNLKAGELVRVRSSEEIRRTLDKDHRNKGLLFMPGMWRYCGKEVRVYKSVRTIQVEATGDVRQLRNTVLLEGAICDGSIVECDRSCFYFWREAWLERVDSSAPTLAA